MTLIFNAYQVTPSEADLEPRLCRLDWIVLNAENKPVRGFSFQVIVSPDDMGTDPLFDCGLTATDIHANGWPTKRIVSKFLSDYGSCTRIVGFDLDASFRIVANEAKRHQLSVGKKIEDRYSFPAIDKTKCLTLKSLAEKYIESV